MMDGVAAPPNDSVWLGGLSMSNVSQLFSFCSSRIHRPNETGFNNDDATSTAVVGLVYQWSSWCHPTLKPDSPKSAADVRSALAQLVHQLQQRPQQQQGLPALKWKEVTVVCGHVQVDESPDALDRYIGDNQLRRKNDSTGAVQTSGNPCPPETLPTLAVVIQTSTMTEAMVHYTPSFRIDLGNNTHPDRRSIQTEVWIPDLIKELETYLPKAFAEHCSIDDSIAMTTPLDAPSDKNNNTEAIRIFVAGDRSSVGKSSVCLGILGYLVKHMGYSPSSLAYIKPATQCEAPQLVQTYCDQVGIDCVPVGPIVYYKGFTRAFLAGETESTSELLAKASDAVDRIAQKKQIVLIDGVGFPSVGSICGTDNASVARACGYVTFEGGSARHPMAVLLIGGGGVGAAVDAFHLNATYFEMHRVPVIGAIFNKLDLEGFYSLENCRSQVTAYFSQNEHQQKLGRQPFGFVPQFPGLATGLDHVDDWIRVFGQHVNVPGILDAAKRVQESQGKRHGLEVGLVMANNDPPAKKMKLSSALSSNSRKPLLTRKEIEQRAVEAGGAPSA